MTDQQTSSTARGLQRTEAAARAALLDVTAYDVSLDLASSEEAFASITRIRFDSRGGSTFLDLKPRSVRSIHLNGRAVDVDLLRQGRVPLETVAGANELVVDAVMAFRNDGEGLHRSVDPADGRHYVYGMSFMDAAPSIFACFDQPDLKAPYTLHVRAPEDWVVIGNAPGSNPEPGVWELETSQPLSTYFVTLVAGPVPPGARRARRHPARPLLPPQHRRGARRGRGRAAHPDPQCFDELPPAVRHPLPLR